MKGISSKLSAVMGKSFLLTAFVFLSVSVGLAQTQSNAADLVGTITDPGEAVVPGATVTAKNIATGVTRTSTSNDSGEFQFIALPPGNYEITAEAATFKKTVISPVTLTVGQRAELGVKLEIGGDDVVVNISGEDVQLVETSRTSVANTIDQARIENLPINERSATGFALTLSTVGRDNGRPIGPAPTSGINVGGQRGRSTQVNVDGADFTDNSINAARTTVGQEAVQEYQVATNSYTPEFGRATGGVVNVVTKSGTNDFRGNIFGFVRDKAIQARNAFAPADLEKPDFTRGQYGITLGGPIVRDRTFFFAAFEGRQRRESGFFTGSIFGAGESALNSSVTVPAALGGQTYSFLTPQQAQRATALLGSNPALAIAYLTLASSGSRTALFGTNTLVSPGGTFGVPAGQVIGSRFLLTGTPVPIGTVNAAGEPIAFRPLTALQRVFPIRDKTHYFSLRGDHSINEANQLTARFSFNPSKVSGIQVESQNQSLGQNDFSRTGITDIQDLSVSSGLTSNLSTNVLNEFTFSYGSRDTSFRSQNNEAVAYNISDTAFIGRELFSPVDRTENRYQFKNNINWIVGNHSLKFGGDINFIEIPTATFELNFAGLFNFGNFAATNLNTAFAGLPDFTPIQSYGLGLPSIYIQGFGNPRSQIKNKPLAFFAQDSWRVSNRLTLNYGVRYDVELTETIAPVGFRDPLTGINLSASDILAAQDAVGVQQGLPRDTNNFAPRLGFALDMFGNAKTVVRGSIGLYYDHPLLAIAFNSDIADAAQQQQAVLTAGSPAPTALLNASQVFQGTVCGAQGSIPTICGAAITPGVAPSAQYQFGRQRFNDQTFTGFGAVLPFILPIAKDFKYASATQANLAIEHQLTKNMSLTVGYIYVGAHNLPRPTDLNSPNTALQIQNFQRFFGGALPTSTQQASAFSIGTTGPGTATGVGCFVVIPGIVAQCPTGRVVAPAVANFFRPNAPNYFLAQALTGGAVTKAVLDSQLAGSLRTPGTLTPFGSVNAQLSDGNSSYNAMNVELKRRFANNYTFLASYTWSHSIDDSSDLQTLLIPQDVNRFDLEKADSLFDQRHRFVFSGVLSSPQGWRSSESWGKKFLADFTVAPIVEISSGRPFNIITNVDTNNDQSTQTDRPSVLADGTLCLPGTAGCTPLITDGRFSTGNLGRNRGILGSYASFDMRLQRSFYFSERVRVDLIAEGFNLFNRFNEASASPSYTAVNATNRRDGAGRYYSRSTATYDQRQFQLGLKLNF